MLKANYPSKKKYFLKDSFWEDRYYLQYNKSV
jgi:hypothetical protein